MCFRGGSVPRYFQVAVADSLEELQRNLQYLNDNIVSGLKALDEADRETWALDKLNALLASGKNSSHAGEASDDAKVRAASRAFHSHFQLPESEKLLYFCSAAYQRVKIELKDVEHLKREKSKGFFSDSIVVSTRNNTQHFFSNLLRRDETFDILEDLTNHAMTRMLKSSANQQLEDSPVASTAADVAGSSRKELLEEQRHNQQFQLVFSLPAGEEMLESTYAVLALPDNPTEMQAQGRLFISTGGFLCFLSSTKYQAQFTLPLFVVSKMERLVDSGTPTICITLWHKMKIILQLLTDAKGADNICNVLKRMLQDQISRMKMVKSFTKTCTSEMLLAGNQVTTGGLSLTFGGIEAKGAKQRNRLKLWQAYFKDHGRNLTLIRNPQLIKLCRIGIPESVRGELWEVCSGAIYQRFLHQGYYKDILQANEGKTSVATEEIEKDLNRSLPEYPAFHAEEGIGALRRVLYAYSFHDPTLGYCQAMNILVSALLVYLEGELRLHEQAFWILTVLCDRLLPRYYTPTMIGAVVDSRVLESMVEKFMPLLDSHFKGLDLQLSIVALPWFLSLFINAFPLSLAYRSLFPHILEGPRFLFQLALAILKINGNGDLHRRASQAKEDGEVMQILKDYFATLERPSVDSGPGARPVQRFTTLLLCAYKEFQGVTSDLVADMRRNHQYRVVQALDVYSKRSRIHELSESSKFSKQELFSICDLYFDAIYHVGKFNAAGGSKMDLSAFHRFLGRVAAWADLEPDRLKRRTRGIDSGSGEVPGQQIIELLFRYFNRNSDDPTHVTLQEVVRGLGEIIFSDASGNADLLFALFDEKRKGYLDRDDIVRLSESLLFVHRDASGDAYLTAVSDFMRKSLAVGAELAQTPPDGAQQQSADGSAGVDVDVRLSRDKFRALLLAEAFLGEQMSQFGPSFVIRPPEKQEAEVRFVGAAVDRVISEGVRWATGFRTSSDTSPTSADARVSERAPESPGEDDVTLKDPAVDGAEAFLESLGIDIDGPETALDEGSSDLDAFLNSLNIER
ncbi:hypothetical protein DFJ74DRAFT_608448 [Hyaloraphidium curvatum]|nr:hypothetical protein DFJ74DRAFT_608448 [Hyaloraphidium curvatum]